MITTKPTNFLLYPKNAAFLDKTVAKPFLPYPSRPKVIVLTLLYLMPLLFLSVLVLPAWYHVYQLKTSGVITSAHYKTNTWSSNLDSIEIIYTFSANNTYQSGTQRVNKEEYAWVLANKWDLPILYVPDNPRVSRLVGFEAPDYGIRIMGGILWLLLAVGLGATVALALYSRVKTKHLLSSGKLVEGEVISCTPLRSGKRIDLMSFLMAIAIWFFFYMLVSSSFFRRRDNGKFDKLARVKLRYCFVSPDTRIPMMTEVKSYTPHPPKEWPLPGTIVIVLYHSDRCFQVL